jgi:DNA-binding beta-propeller fold protein YncE
MSKAVGDTLEIIDISNPSNPVFKGNYDIYSGRDVQIVGNYAYVADDLSGLQIIDISNPAAPSLKGNYGTSSYARDVQIVGNYAYVADDNSGKKPVFWTCGDRIFAMTRGKIALGGFLAETERLMRKASPSPSPAKIFMVRK